MEEIKKTLSEIQVDIAEIKVDLRHHIKRSDKHENHIHKIILIIAISAGAGIFKLAPFISRLF